MPPKLTNSFHPLWLNLVLNVNYCLEIKSYRNFCAKKEYESHNTSYNETQRKLLQGFPSKQIHKKKILRNYEYNHRKAPDEFILFVE